MAFYDALNTFYDSGIRYDEPVTPAASQPHAKLKKMKRQAYYPSRNADQITGTSSNLVDTMNLSVNDPPTHADVQTLADKLDQLINALRR